MPATLRHARTPTLDIAYEQTGPEDGDPVLLLHGWPYSPRTYDAVVAALHGQRPDLRLLVPFLRGFGPTRYRSAETPRSGQQAALGRDAVDLLDALAIPQATLVGYDWGGRAACVAAALWPERVRGLLAVDGYAIQNIAEAATTPGTVEGEFQYWYQWYFQTGRGRAGLEAHRSGITRKLWTMWSPAWRIDDAFFAENATAFDNPDFVATTIHSYRHRYGNVAGDPALELLEQRLAARPEIPVPTVAVRGADDRVTPPAGNAAKGSKFTGPYKETLLPGVGHCPPAEAPAAVVQGILDLLAMSVR